MFNAKELDDNTGLYYYGARYYDPRISVWLNNGTLVELKSYSASTLTSDVYGIATKQTFINQFKTYLQNPAGFQYWFNGLKDVNATIIKDGFKKLYQKPNMWSTLTDNGTKIPPSWVGITTESQFFDKLDDYNSVLYNFIHIQN